MQAAPMLTLADLKFLLVLDTAQELRDISNMFAVLKVVTCMSVTLFMKTFTYKTEFEIH